MKIGFIVQDDNQKFLKNIIEYLELTHEVRTCFTESGLQALLDWADLVWVEWVEELAVKVSRMSRNGKLVLRLNCHEAHTSIPSKVAWENVDRLFVVSESVLKVLKLRVADLEKRVQVDILHSGVDMTRFGFKDDFTPTGKVAFVGSLGHTKNLPFLMQCFNALVMDAPETTLHVAGSYCGPELERIELAMYLNHMVAGMGLEGRVSLLRTGGRYKQLVG